MNELSKLKMLIEEQAKDEALWFQPNYILEDYLQRALRRLHFTIEEFIKNNNTKGD